MIAIHNLSHRMGQTKRGFWTMYASVDFMTSSTNYCIIIDLNLPEFYSTSFKYVECRDIIFSGC